MTPATAGGPARPANAPLAGETAVTIPSGHAMLAGDLVVPAHATGIVLFVHGSGSSRKSTRNRYVAGVLQRAGLATLLFDLLTPEEETVDAVTAEHRFDIPMLARRLADATLWVAARPELKGLPIGYFGASTGAAAALIAAALAPEGIAAVVSRGGRPDLAGEHLPHVRAPTLFIVGGRDEQVIALNAAAYRRMRAPCHLAIVPGATHLFEEPGALEQVAALAAKFFTQDLHRPVEA